MTCPMSKWLLQVIESLPVFLLSCHPNCRASSDIMADERLTTWPCLALLAALGWLARTSMRLARGTGRDRKDPRHHLVVWQGCSAPPLDEQASAHNSILLYPPFRVRVLSCIADSKMMA